MQKYQNVVLNQFGAPVLGATITVRDYPSNALSNIFSDNGLTQIANPTTTGGTGAFAFYAADGHYSVVISGPGLVTETITDILLEDPDNPSSYTISGGTINNVSIGNITPGSGVFTTLAATSFTIGSLNATPIGNTTPSTGVFTTLTATNLNGALTGNATTATLASNSSQLLAGTWAIPGSIGITTPNTGAFTTLSSIGATALGVTVATSINTTPIGNTTPSTGVFTTCSATTFTGALFGNATTATTATTANSAATLATSRTIAGISFNGSANIPISNTNDVATASDRYPLFTDGTSIPAVTAITKLIFVPSTGTLRSSNFSFLGAGSRLSGDFDNATFANRTLFQTTTTNTNTQVGVIPNGTATQAGIIAQTGVSANESFATFGIVGATEARIQSGATGSGTLLPLSLYTSAVKQAQLDNAGNLTLVSATGAVGYATGSGGTVTQATSKATAVTLSKSNGQIITNAASLATATIVSFTVTNTLVTANDIIAITHQSVGTVGSYTVTATAAAGSFTVFIRNNSALALAEAIVLQFAIIRSVIA